MTRYVLIPAPIAILPVRSARSMLAVLLALLLTHQAAAQNIVLILSDDQGWTGTSVQMDDRVADSVSDLYRTPSLERLAAEGMKFSNAYSPAPNCSPTRMSIQTGKTAARLGATDIIDVVADENGVANIQVFHDTMYFNKPMIVPFPVSDIADEETTIAELLKQHDPAYATGHFGKWHMGGGSPERHGYDAHNGLTSNDEGFAPQPDAKRSDEVTATRSPSSRSRRSPAGPSSCRFRTTRCTRRYGRGRKPWRSTAITWSRRISACSATKRIPMRRTRR